MAMHNDEHNSSTLLKKIHDQEQHIEFLHRQQRDVRFLTKRLIMEVRTRVNRRANAIVERHLVYKHDEEVKALINYDSRDDILAKIRALDRQNINLQNISLLNRAKPLFWGVIAGCFNGAIKVSKGIISHVK